MTVSIIIPMYNVEPYIIRCVDSVLRQTHRQLEVILIDDCSPDHSMEIARKHIEASASSRDLKFIYIRHKKNRGLSAARNSGIDAATGEYVYFLDGDDEITEDCMETLTHEAIRHPEVDIVCGDCIEPYEGKRRVYHIDEYRYYDKNDQIRYCLFCPQQSMPIIACNKLVNLRFIKDNNLYFGEGLVHEDILWTFQVVTRMKHFAMLPHGTYIYHLNNDSINFTTSEVRTSQSMSYSLGVIADSADEPFGLLAQYKYLLRWFNIYKHLSWRESQPTSIKFCRSLWNYGARDAAVATWLYFRLYKIPPLRRIEWRLTSYIRQKYLQQDHLAKQKINDKYNRH